MIERKKVAEMTGAELERALAQVTGLLGGYHQWRKLFGISDTPEHFERWQSWCNWHPLTDWAPVAHYLDQLDITLSVARDDPDGGREYLAEAWGNLRKGTSIRARSLGKTRLEAICRCVVTVYAGNDL